MDVEKLIDVTKDYENKSNKDLFDAVNLLYEEHEKTKELIIELTKHLENVEYYYNKVNDEVGKRIKK
jgi:hypothetical protein